MPELLPSTVLLFLRLLVASLTAMVGQFLFSIEEGRSFRLLTRRFIVEFPILVFRGAVASYCVVVIVVALVIVIIELQA